MKTKATVPGEFPLLVSQDDAFDALFSNVNTKKVEPHTFQPLSLSSGNTLRLVDLNFNIHGTVNLFVLFSSSS